jgi:hypothetical protein
MQKRIRVLLEGELLFASHSFSQNTVLQMGVRISAGDSLITVITNLESMKLHFSY